MLKRDQYWPKTFWTVFCFSNYLEHIYHAWFCVCGSPASSIIPTSCACSECVC